MWPPRQKKETSRDPVVSTVLQLPTEYAYAFVLGFLDGTRQAEPDRGIDVPVVVKIWSTDHS
jgi:hypothetical protein